ncbi:ArsO family NAD(P)H-dependent flavin-containing monooxygenase [Mucilaginibacter psychrotolerans]|uniref:Pyridine nucleotide-disulfide oxidoreductase n=1 Tax=Mucilaginibacter psychrotolerans TaxID=1524096 RepID=A0A4Y8SF81_9SPHI|nr:ArsO family NAD(P)H-dependent flavin-containing monooxygenase [Mucilaginibacter psychrotolerans]TFF37743.1 pyridine nucleotide-disulfide oxidoreductase [Mucilaginibacter psychrotolerans]
MIKHDIIVIGGGQSALACAYFLNREKHDYLLLDNQQSCGGAWLHGWDSLTLFSPATNSTLPGRPMPASQGKFPTREEVLAYLCDYERHYHIPVERPVEVVAVNKTTTGFEITSNKATYLAKAVIGATGNWQSPFIPNVPGRDTFSGIQIHSAQYRNSNQFLGKKVLIIGGGNSGAQLFAELSSVTDAAWSTQNPPAYLPDDVDGSVLFNQATAKYKAQQQGVPYNAADYSLGNIVMVPSVVAARERGVLQSKGAVKAIDNNGVIWDDGIHEYFDILIWCTGFQPATFPLKQLGIVADNQKVRTTGTKAVEINGLWLVGYGNWTGFASATLIGVGRSAKDTVNEITTFLNNYNQI